VIKNIETNLKWKGEDCIIKATNTSKRSVFEYGIIVESQAAALTPINDGRLRGSIVTKTKDKTHSGRDFGKTYPEDIIPSPNDDTETRAVALVGTDVKYANAVEYGSRPHFPPVDMLKTWAKKVLGDEKLAWPVAIGISKKGTQAQPYMRPAIDLTQGKALTVFKNNGRTEFKEYFKEKA